MTKEELIKHLAEELRETDNKAIIGKELWDAYEGEIYWDRIAKAAIEILTPHVSLWKA